MILFWLLVGLMVLAALALLLPPLLRPRKAIDGATARDGALGAHRVRMTALERQRADGSLSEEAFEDALDELEQQVLVEAGSPAGATAPARPAVAAAVAVAVAVPLLSVMVYLGLGRSELVSVLDDPQKLQAAALAHPPGQEEMLRLAHSLDLRLAVQPDDLDGWRLLARTRLALEQYPLAASALEHAVRLAGSDPDVLVDSVEALSMASDMRFPPTAQERIERALTLAPAHPKGLMLGALAALQRGERDRALERFRQLLATQPAGSERALFLERLMARIEGEAAEQAPASGGARISVTVQVAPSLRDALSGQERVFVFARRAEGPPMPLAVRTLAASALPTEVMLDDSMGMVAGHTLSSADRVVIGARISASGSATPGSGDLEGFSGPLEPGKDVTTTVVISSRRQ